MHSCIYDLLRNRLCHFDVNYYKKIKTVNWPNKSTEYVIDGGNHAQFGDYGVQSGDGNATISKVGQWNLTTAKIVERKNT